MYKDDFSCSVICKVSGEYTSEIYFQCLIAVKLAYSFCNLFEPPIWSHFLYIRIALVILHIWRKIRVSKDKCIIDESGTESSFSNLSIETLGLLGSAALFFAVLLIITCSSFSFTRSKKKEFRFLCFKQSVILDFDFGVLSSTYLRKLSVVKYSVFDNFLFIRDNMFHLF